MSWRPSALNPTVLRLGWVSFLADVASDMLYPITPIFLTATLGASMTSVGLIEGFADCVASFLKMGAGTWSDRLGRRKPFVLVGYLLSTIAKPLTGFTTAWSHVLLARALDRTGKGLRTAPRDAILAESASAEERGAAFGWHRAMDTAGAVVGPLFALLYLSLFQDNLRQIFFWALLPGLLATALVLTVPERARPPIARREPLGLLQWSWMPPAFRRYLAVWGIFSLVNSSDVFLLMKAKSDGLSTAGVVLLYCVFNVFYAGLSPFFGALSDRVGRRRLLLIGLGTFSVVYAGFALAGASWMYWPLFALYGLYQAASEGTGKALAVDLVPPERKASALGALGLVTGLATLLASVIAGALWDHVSESAPFWLGAAGALLAAFLLARSPQWARSPVSK